MTAAEKILQKALVTSDIGAEKWNSVQAGLRDRAFFSARVAEVRFLDAMRSQIAESLSGNLSQSEFRKAVREMLTHGGYDAGENRGTIKDLMTKARLDVIFDTNRKMAQGYVQHLQAISPGALEAFPAYELLRAERRKMPRNWPAIWQQKGGRLYNGRMIAAKTDPIWVAISRFGLPYPPFDYNSGMDIFSVSRSECLALGVPLPDPGSAEGASAPSFNEGLEVKDPDGSIYKKLRKHFGDQVRHVDGKIVWRQEVLRKTLFTDNFKIALGAPDERGLLSKLSAQKPLAEFAKDLRDKKLTVDQTWRDAKRADGTNHLSHFFPDPANPNNIPLTLADVELLPSIWRNPDRVRKLQRDIFEAELDAIDGNILTIQVWANKTKGGVVPKLWTFYKKKASAPSPTTGGQP